MKAEEMRTGLVVKLRSGGPVMTAVRPYEVSTLRDPEGRKEIAGEWVCTWFDQATLCSAKFWPETLDSA